MADLQLVSNARAEYLDHYRQLIHTMRSTEETLAVELLILANEPPGESVEECYRLFRIDIATKPKDQPKLTDAGLSKLPEGRPVRLETDSGFAAEIHPFLWNECEVQLVGDVNDWTPVIDWFRTWIDEAETKPEDDYGMSGVIHRVTKPQHINGRNVFLVDFGSAPEEALFELLGSLEATGVSEAVMCSAPPEDM